MRLPPFAALRAFEAVSRHLSVRKAALELAVDHTVVSRHIRSLQAVLDVKLLHTSPQGVTLTEAGRQYAAALTPAFAAMAAATARLTDQRLAASLTIWSVPGFALRWLIPRLTDYRHANPGVEINVRPADSPPDLMGFEADAAISFGTVGHAQDAAIRQAVLARPRVFPVASPHWLAAHDAPIEPAALVGAPLIHEESHEQWRQWFAAAGLAAPERLTGTRLWHAHLALEAAKLGQGVALANDLLIGNDLATGALAEVGTTEVRLQPYVLTARRDRWNEPALRHFRRWLIQNLR